MEHEATRRSKEIGCASKLPAVVFVLQSPAKGDLTPYHNMEPTHLF